MRFGERIKELRQRRQMSLRDLAGKLNISASYLSDIENGRNRAPSTSDKSNFINDISFELGLSEEEKNELFYLADEELSNYFTIAHELGHYLSITPQARIALRKAANSKVENNTWEKFIEIIDEDEKKGGTDDK
ncbi:MAG: helix-turn-helix domain-containing protein [Solobacterium sp.]|nr:helix-turn-helix domain-containing protein [Solobacterium sp.]